MSDQIKPSNDLEQTGQPEPIVPSESAGQLGLADRSEQGKQHEADHIKDVVPAQGEQYEPLKATEPLAQSEQTKHIGEVEKSEQPEKEHIRHPEEPKQGEQLKSLTATDLPNGTEQKKHTGEAEESNQVDQSNQPKIPKTCKAGCVVNAGPDFTVSVEDVNVPEPGPDEILLRLNATGVCYSDLHYMLEDLPMPRMSSFNCRSPGHEGAGVVVKVGSNVTTWKVGDRGGVKPMWDICMNCELCWDGSHETYCEKAVATGLMQTGTYQHYITSPAKYTTRIPDNVDDFTAGPIMCSGSTIYRSITESQLKSGDWAVFPGGGGGVGHMGVQIAKAMGMRVIAIDGGAEKRTLCQSLGAEEFIDFTEVESVEAEVLRITGGKGAHGVFVTAGSAAAYKSAPMMVRVGGKVMCVGLPPNGSATVGADPAWFIFKNLHVIGTMVGSMKDTDKALDFAARGLLKPIYEKFPISRLPEAVQKLREGKVAGRCVVDFNS